MGRADTKKCFLRKVQHLPDVGACSGDFTARASLSPERIRLLKIRSGCRKSLQYVCDGHFTKFIHRFEAHQKNCCLHQSTSVHDGPPAKKKKSGTPQLHVITLQMRDSAKTIGLALVPGKKVCVKCKIDLNAKIKAAEKSAAGKAAQESSSNAPDPASISNPPIFSSPSVGSTLAPSDITTPTVPADKKASKEEFFQESIDGLNTWLSSLGFSPVNERKLKTQKSYGRKVMKKIRAALTKFSDQQLTEDEDAAYFREIIGQLQQFIDCHPQPDKKLLALSVVPKSWSISRIESTFGVSNYMARKSRLLVQDKGILCGPGPKVGRKLSPETVELITKFYYRDDISRPLPGAKDVLSVLVDGKRVKKTKRLVLSTLSCLHQKFKEEHPDHKVSLAKFCELRPKECVLAGSAGTHVICVCTYHQNPELMFEAGNLSEAGLENIKACKKLLLCSEPSEDCFFRRCNDCCDSTVLQEKLEVYFDSEMISTVVYNQWESTDRANIVTLSKSTDDFISEFISQIESLIPHDFISKVQANFYKESIENLKDGEVVVNVDFAENFSFVVQNSSQGWYFNNKQATLHPV
ncbi:uncharacterized protein LOC117652423 [Thrips palmi]|uniref:Uncharacterized protein LOC117652423 n=1 Tax=Thrips palmi TaxID=161013 RepID=A0A6P9A5H8_THRPL|nr:uncharacterized protein LOC117652423 [Thrips palmi]